MICRLSGSLFVNLYGMLISGMLVRLIGIVKILFVYIVSGFFVFLLILNVGVGVVGLIIILYFLNMFLKFFLIKVCIFCVFL